MKKRFCAFLVVILLISALIPVSANAASPRMRSIVPGLTLDGTTAHCELLVTCDMATDEISATIKLWTGSSCVATWYDTDYGVLSFYATRTIISGNTYTLTADVTINGQAYPRVSITKP